jgi:DNA primase catalytic core
MNVGELKDGTQAIKNASPIARVISQYVRLRKSGPQMVGLCPFHKEKTPSFTVHPTKNLFKCFGCGEGGDVFRFVQLIEGVDFKQARAILAERAGISTAERHLTREEKREYGRKLDLAEHEANDLLSWLDRLIQALQEGRNTYFHSYHRALRFLRSHPADQFPAEVKFAKNVADVHWVRVMGFDRRISVLKNADFARLLPLFRARKTGRKAVAA